MPVSTFFGKIVQKEWKAYGKKDTNDSASLINMVIFFQWQEDNNFLFVSLTFLPSKQTMT